MPPSIEYIAVVHISDRVRDKLAEKHDGVQDWEVREAVVLCDVEDSWWDLHEERGWRLMVVGETAAKRVLKVVLYPDDLAMDDGVWNLGTAMRKVGT